MLFISLGFLINGDTDPNKLKDLSRIKLELNISKHVDIILDTTDKETIQKTSMDQIYQKLSKIDEEIKLMVYSIVDFQEESAPSMEAVQTPGTAPKNTTINQFNLLDKIQCPPEKCGEGSEPATIKEIYLDREEYLINRTPKGDTIITFNDAHELYYKI